MGKRGSRPMRAGLLTSLGVGAGLVACGAALALRRDLRRARAHLEACGARSIALAHGPVSFVDDGQGAPLLSLHGLYGGFDQALGNARGIGARCRVIAPSRFGYPGSAVRGGGTPAEQAEVLAELLDHLGIERALVLGASAGGTPAIRFALDHPERVMGLILLSSAAPWVSRPPRPPGRLGPPAWMSRDWIMWLASPLFGPLMGMPRSTIHGMLPLAPRRAGADLDARVTNRDMAVRFEDYPIEELEVPVLLVHARDDRVARFAPPKGGVQASLHRYPDLTAVIVETGGHLLVGPDQRVEAAISEFIAAHSR
ncbi:alpha/beta fold hydrolase [Actinomyces bowdenii]|nr:alpha/beta fold hydrolase [Actinomyces bowdenii]